MTKPKEKPAATKAGKSAASVKSATAKPAASKRAAPAAQKSTVRKAPAAKPAEAAKSKPGAAKAATGLAAMGLAPALGLSLVWARPFFLYGPGEPPGRLFGDIIKGVSAGQPVACTDGLQRRDFLHAADVAGALAHLLASDATGAVNLGSGRAIEVRQMIGELARQMGREDLIRLGARPRPADDPALIEAGITRLAATGFRPHHDLQSGISAVLTAEKAQA